MRALEVENIRLGQIAILFLHRWTLIVLHVIFHLLTLYFPSLRSAIVGLVTFQLLSLLDILIVDIVLPALRAWLSTVLRHQDLVEGLE